MTSILSRRRFGALMGAIPFLSLARAPDALAASKMHSVTIRRFVFEPAELTIAVGDQITWTNHDIAPHTATQMDDGLWDTGELRQNDTGTLQFDQPGIFPYHCVFHPHMKGVVQVVR